MKKKVMNTKTWNGRTKREKAHYKAVTESGRQKRLRCMRCSLLSCEHVYSILQPPSPLRRRRTVGGRQVDGACSTCLARAADGARGWWRRRMRLGKQRLGK